jgi:hypothetical protein
VNDSPTLTAAYTKLFQRKGETKCYKNTIIFDRVAAEVQAISILQCEKLI